MRHHQRCGVRTVPDSRPSVAVGKTGRNPGRSGFNHEAVGVDKGYIGIENNKPDAIALLTEKAKAYPHIEVVPLQVKYPQGGEKQLIAAVTGREVPAPPAIAH